MVITIIFVIAVVLGGLVLIGVSKKAENDQLRANALDQGLQKFLSRRSSLPSSSSGGIREYTGLRLGEVSRHFDASTTATITGWMTHDLGFHGWGPEPEWAG